MLQPRNLDKIVRLTEGYSGSDLTAVRTILYCTVYMYCISCKRYNELIEWSLMLSSFFFKEPSLDQKSKLYILDVVYILLLFWNAVLLCLSPPPSPHPPLHYPFLQVCQEAALGPIRELGAAALRTVKAEDVRNLNEQVTSLFWPPTQTRSLPDTVAPTYYSYFPIDIINILTFSNHLTVFFFFLFFHWKGFCECDTEHSTQCIQREFSDLSEMGWPVRSH